MNTQDKIVQELSIIHSIELALVQTLTSHIAITPRGRYRDVLERHLGETKTQAGRIQERMADLGAGRNPIRVAVGTVEAAVGQALALGKAPLDLIRGASGEEKLLRNARDEAASEALEIASYDALEAIATQLGDETTAQLARDHRAQEEQTLRDLREVIPQLARDVVAAQVQGEPVYDVGTTGAADAVRDAARFVRRAGRKAQDEAVETAQEAGAATRAAASDVAEAAEETVDATRRTAQRTAAKAQEAATDAVRAIPGEQEIEGEIRGTQARAEDLAIAGYDTLTVEQILPKLRLLPELELAKVDAYEREHRARKRVLDRIRQLRERQPAGTTA
jgi:ferritin-like metal-binding protein YciE